MSEPKIPGDLQVWYEVACDGIHFANNPKAIKALIERIAALEANVADYKRRFALLANPSAVHANILRGALPLTKAQAIHIAGLPANIEGEVARLKRQLASAEEIAEALHAKFDRCPHPKHICGCSFDRPSDVCALHAPQLRKALEEIERLGALASHRESSAEITG